MSSRTEMKSRTVAFFLVSIMAFLSMASAEAAAPSIPPGAPFSANSPITIGDAPTTASQAIGISSKSAWRAIAIRDGYPNAGPSDGYTQGVTSRQYFPLANRGQIAAIRVCYGNFGANGTLAYEQNAVYPLTITSSVEFNTTTPAGTWFPGGAGATHQYPLTFNGQSSATLPISGAPVCSDPLYYPFVSPQSIYVWTYTSTSASWFSTAYTRSNYKETVNNGAFTINSPSQASNTTQTFTIAPQSTTSVSLLPIRGLFNVTGPGITGTATATCSGGTSAISGTGISSGSVVCTTGAVSLTFPSAVSGTFVTKGYATAAGIDETQVFGPSDLTEPFTPVFGPSAIEAQLAPAATSSGVTSQNFPFALMAVGDSIITGIGGNADDRLSFLDYAVMSNVSDITTATIGVAKISQPSEMMANFLLNNYRRMKLQAGRYDEIVTNSGGSELGGSPTLLQFQTTKIAEWSFLAQTLPHGFRDIYQTSILPRTVSNSSQTPFNSNYTSGNSLRNQVNAWMCAQVGVYIGGFLDTSFPVEGSPGTCTGTGDGTWKLLSYTNDGTNPTTAGHQLIGTYIGVSGPNPSPAFVGH